MLGIKELIKTIFMNKEEQFEVVFRENKDKVFRLCKGFLGDRQEADDLFQEVFINVWKGLDKFRGGSQVSTWVYRIASNTAMLYQKRSRRAKAMVSSQNDFSYLNLKEKGDGLTEKLEQEKMLNQLLESISTLEKTNRIIITMVLEDFSYKEISEVTGISVNYVGVRVNRIKALLRRRLKNKL